MKKGKVLMFVTTLLLTIILAGCGGSNTPKSNNQAGSTPADSSQVKEYIVGTNANYAPFESVNDKNEIIGFEMDVLNAAAEKGGFIVKFINTPWEGIFTTLLNGDRDFLASGITITDERKIEMDFSEPYFESKQLIVVGKDSKIANVDDLKGKIIGVQTGSTGDEVVSKLFGIDSTDIKRFEGTPLALKELENGGVEAVVADNGVVSNYVNNNSDKGFKMLEDASFEKEFYGFPVKKGNKEVLDKVNEGLNKIKEDGTFNKIYEQYFGKM